MPSRRGVLKTLGGLAGVSTLPRAGAGSGDDVRLVEADPESGFNYPYYLSVPGRTPDGERPILVEPNNTGTATDDYEVHRASAREQAAARWVSDRLRVPHLVPAFPRPESDPVDWRHNPHELNRAVMLLEDGPLERPDLQLRRMIRHAQRLLSEEGHAVREEVLLNGFSSSGNFSHRFAALHPDIVAAVAAGGVNGMPILPLDADRGHTLNYQIGVADLPRLTGDRFDLERFRTVDFYFYMGAEDGNDTLPNEDVWSPGQIPVAYDVYGEDMLDDRFPYAESVYEAVGVPADFRVYDGVGHEVTAEMSEDVAGFFAESTGLESTGDLSFPGVLEALGVPVEAAVGTSVAVLGGVAYLLRRLDRDDGPRNDG